MLADGGVLDKTSVAGATADVRAQVFAALDRRLDPASCSPLAVGLSGGSDSLALLVFALDWARAAGRRVLAFTVDHGLNPDSAGWTAEAGHAARTLGAEWRALRWSGAKPSTGLSAAARQARHALLADAVREAGAKVLLLGHTMDDVAESELIRRETPGHGHLHEWTPSPAWPQGRGVFLLRPLLGVRRCALRSVLAERRLGWLEDPANADPGFARIRARQALARDPWTVSSSKVRGIGLRTQNTIIDTDRAGVVALTVAGLPRERSVAILACAVACAAGGQSPARGAAMARLAVRLGTEQSGAGTLGGARIAFADGVATLCRELGRRPPTPTRLAPGGPQVFDGRFELVADVAGWRVAPLAGHAASLPAEDRRGLAEIAAIARPTLPVLLDDQGSARLPRPFGDGPAAARELVSGRLAAALGGIDNERLLARALRPCAVHGA